MKNLKLYEEFIASRTQAQPAPEPSSPEKMPLPESPNTTEITNKVVRVDGWVMY